MEVSNLSRYTVMLAWLLVSLGIVIVATGCSSSKSSTPGLLEQNGIKNADDLVSVVLVMPESKSSYLLITDSATISRIYQLLNEAKRASGMSKYIRPDMVTLVRKNGSALSFAFGLYNPNLTWQYSSRPFTEFVKTELAGNSKYLNNERLPAFSISQIARIESAKTRKILPSTRIGNLQSGVNAVASAYKPYVSTTQVSTWNGIAGFFTSESPGIEVVLQKPTQFKTLVGMVGVEPSQGSTALKLVTLTVDRLVIYLGENRDLSMAFHSTAGSPSWYTTGRFGQNELQGRTASSIYRELVGSTK